MDGEWLNRAILNTPYKISCTKPLAPRGAAQMAVAETRAPRASMEDWVRRRRAAALISVYPPYAERVTPSSIRLIPASCDNFSEPAASLFGTVAPLSHPPLHHSHVRCSMADQARIRIYSLCR